VSDIEITPPLKKPCLRDVEEQSRRFVELRDRSVPRPVFPGSPVKSGHWWAIIIGRGNAFQGSAPQGYVELMLNGQTLQFPLGVWAVIDNDKFQVAKQSDLPMMWLDGDRLMEKTIEPRRQGRSGTEYHVIGAREVTSAPTAHGPALIEG
jgi:predicted MPP superfamily phosphohydrolase